MGARVVGKAMRPNCGKLLKPLVPTLVPETVRGPPPNGGYGNNPGDKAMDDPQPLPRVLAGPCLRAFGPDQAPGERFND